MSVAIVDPVSETLHAKHSTEHVTNEQVEVSP